MHSRGSTYICWGDREPRPGDIFYVKPQPCLYSYFSEKLTFDNVYSKTVISVSINNNKLVFNYQWIERSLRDFTDLFNTSCKIFRLSDYPSCKLFCRKPFVTSPPSPKTLYTILFLSIIHSY